MILQKADKVPLLRKVLISKILFDKVLLEKLRWKPNRRCSIFLLFRWVWLVGVVGCSG